MTFSAWPFSLPVNRLPAEEMRWWQDCHLPSPAQKLVEDQPQGCIICAGYQSGRSTLISSIKRSSQGKFLILEDDFLSQAGPKEPAGNAVFRLLHQASWQLRENFREKPEQFASFPSKTLLEFLRWAIEKFHGRRAFLRWLDGLPNEHAKSFSDMPFDDFYATQEKPYDVQGQLEELVNFSRKLGYQGALYLVDVVPFPNTAQLDELRALLGWRELMQHDGLKIVIALPPILPQNETLRLSRQRLPLIEMTAQPEFTREVVSRHLRAATDGALQSLEEICCPELLNLLEVMLTEEFGAPPIGAWLKLIGILLERATQSSMPLREDALPIIRLAYTSRFRPLHGDMKNNSLGVWRGYQWISLDRSLYDFLALMAAHPGRFVDHQIARTSKNNLHTLVSRLRKLLEPPEENVYLQNVKGEGYSLSNYRPEFP